MHAYNSAAKAGFSFWRIFEGSERGKEREREVGRTIKDESERSLLYSSWDPSLLILRRAKDNKIKKDPKSIKISYTRSRNVAALQTTIAYALTTRAQLLLFLYDISAHIL